MNRRLLLSRLGWSLSLLLLVGCASDLSLGVKQQPGDAPKDLRGATAAGPLTDLLAADISPDGKYLLVGTSCCLEMIDANAFHAIWMLTTQRPVMVISFSPDGDQFVVRDSLHTGALYESPSGTKTASLTLPDQIYLYDVGFTPDGKSLVGHVSRQGLLESILAFGVIWDLSSGVPLYTLDRYLAENPKVEDWIFVRQVRGGGLDAVAAHNPIVTVYDAKTGTIYRQYATDGYQVVACSPDGSLLATGASDFRKIVIWNTYAGTQNSVITVDPIDSTMWQLKWSPDQSQIAMITHLGTIYIWDVSTSQLLRTIPFKHDDARILWGADNQTLYALGYKDRLVAWDVTSGKEIRSLGPAQ